MEIKTQVLQAKHAFCWKCPCFGGLNRSLYATVKYATTKRAKEQIIWILLKKM
jgi:hypothetical protein